MCLRLGHGIQRDVDDVYYIIVIWVMICMCGSGCRFTDLTEILLY